MVQGSIAHIEFILSKVGHGDPTIMCAVVAKGSTRWPEVDPGLFLNRIRPLVAGADQHSLDHGSEVFIDRGTSG